MANLGVVTTGMRLTPVKITEEVISTAAGGAHTLMVRSNGSLWACGSNLFGQPGDGSTTDRVIPVKIMEDVVKADTGS